MIYPMTKDYVNGWTVVEACRELISNAIDTGHYKIELDNGTLMIESYTGALPKEALLFGYSQKKNEAAIGQFGEGLKLAMLVLARDNIDYTFQNGEEFWVFSLKEKDGLELLHHRRAKARAVDNPDRVTIYVNVGEHEHQVRQNTLQLRNVDRIKTTYGSVILEEQGRLYMGGVYICDTGFDYSYDLPVGSVPMNRDRGTVPDFDLKWHLRDLWLVSGRRDLWEAMLRKDSPDVAGFEHRPTKVEYVGNTGIMGRAYSACIGITGQRTTLQQRVESFYKNNKGRMTPLVRARYRQELM